VFNQVLNGSTVNFAENLDTVRENLAEVRPHVFFAVPRIWEKLYNAVELRMRDASWGKRRLYAWAKTVGATLNDARNRALEEGRDPASAISATLRRQHALADAAVLRPLREKLGLDRVRFALSGAAPISPDVIRYFQSIGVPLVEGYGMTETTAAVTYLMPADHRRALAGEPHLLLAAGRAMLGTEIRIVDDDDQPVPNGTIGEIIARGPQLMRGYWNLPEASEQALRGGWMHTGDAGILDDEGFLYIQDRVKDMIVSGGENVYPREVEDVLFQHPAVADVAVIGVPDEKWGEAVKAIVVLKEGATADAEALLAHCKGQLGGYKRPRSVEFIEALPRNPSGKVLKKDLREKYWAGQSRRVS
jgi:acyl-CoA synthetase (AMP-forming)/AMP-acid ligase II